MILIILYNNNIYVVRIINKKPTKYQHINSGLKGGIPYIGRGPQTIYLIEICFKPG